MPVQFRNHRLNDHGKPQIVENAFRAYANYSGVHDFNFDLLYALAGANWNDDSGVTVTANTSQIAVDASALAAGWHMAYEEALELPNSYLLRYHKTQYRQGVVLNMRPNGDHILVVTDDSGHLSIIKSVNDVVTTVLSLPDATPEEADVQIVFREMTGSGEAVSSDTGGLWHAISVWMNGRLAGSYIEEAVSPLIGTWYFGFVAYGGESATYTAVSIPEMTDFAEWNSLDPGEYPMSGLQRAIDGRYIKFYLRFNGELRAWRTKATPSALTFTADILDSQGESIDYRELRTHIRQVGAYVEAEYLDPALVRKYGHRFEVENNPYILGQQACYTEARKQVLRRFERAVTEQFTSTFTPLLEPEDHITTPTAERIVSGKSLSVQMGEIEQQISARTYTYGS